jgi:large subunit ribosomal protein L5
MKQRLGHKNDLAVPRLVKVVISVGTGRAVSQNKNANDLRMDRLTKIAGQKPALRPARQSVAAFKIREGDPIGIAVTLRGKRMHAFLDRLINVAIPRMRDFRGISETAIDAVGNITIGIREHTIFPETADEELKDVFGFAVTIVTTAKGREEAKELLVNLGVPFVKSAASK